MSKLRLILVAAITLLLSACEYLPFSSGALIGDVVSAPEDWTEVASQDIVKLETNAGEPYSVNIWVVTNGSHLYVFAGDNYAAWIEDIESNPDVRMLMGGNIYELRAEHITDPAEFEWFAQAWETKYGNRPRNENVNETYLMKLSAR